MSESFLVYIGTETKQASRGIYSSRLDLDAQRLSEPIEAAALSSPCFLTTNSQQSILYCTGKPVSTDLSCYTVASFAIDRSSGKLSLLNQQSLPDTSFCHIRTAHDGHILMGADYSHAKAMLFALDGKGVINAPTATLNFDSASATVPDRQQVPHIHSINPDISESFLLVCDFSADAIRTYCLNPANLSVTPANVISLSAGSGPRHLVCHPNGNWVYAVNELNGTIDRFAFSGDQGLLTHCQTIATLPADYHGDNTAAEIALSPDCRFLYASNRGHDSVATYRVDVDTGELVLQGFTSTEGEHPRYFVIDPSGRFMLISNRDSDNVTLFRLDPETGLPKFANNQISLSMPMGMVIVTSLD
jgi:6-phosphogluconolactonase